MKSVPRKLGRAELDILRLVAINAYRAYSNTLIGNAPPKIKAEFERLSKPRVGDVVLEVSTVWRWARYAEEAPRSQYPELGVLLRACDEPIPYDPDDYESGMGLPVPTELVWYVRPLDGSVPEYRWTNASFIRVSTALRLEEDVDVTDSGQEG